MEKIAHIPERVAQMPDDYTGIMIIGVGFLALVTRIVTAASRARAIDTALKQHHAPKPYERYPIANKVASLAARIPKRLRIGLALGGVSFLVSAAPVALQAQLPATLVDGPVARAAWLAAKWVVLGSLIQGFRKWVAPNVRVTPPAAAAVPQT